MIKKYFIFFFIFMFFLVAVSGATSYVFQRNTDVDLKISCFDINNSLCSSTTPCQLTINSPNHTNIIKNVSMTFNDNYYNYTLNSTQTNINGEHSVVITCQGDDIDGFSTFSYEINPTGIRPTEQRTESITRSIYFIFGIGVLFFIAFVFFSGNLPVRWTFLIMSVIFFLIGINVVFVSLQDEVVNPNLENLFSFITVASFYLYWFGFGMILLIWMLTFLNTWLYKKNMSRFQRFGG